MLLLSRQKPDSLGLGLRFRHPKRRPSSCKVQRPGHSGMTSSLLSWSQRHISQSWVLVYLRFVSCSFQAGAMVPAIFQPLAFRQFHQLPPNCSCLAQRHMAGRLCTSQTARQTSQQISSTTPAKNPQQKWRACNWWWCWSIYKLYAIILFMASPLHSPWFGIGFSMQALDWIAPVVSIRISARYKPILTDSRGLSSLLYILYWIDMSGHLFRAKGLASATLTAPRSPI